MPRAGDAVFLIHPSPAIRTPTMTQNTSSRARSHLQTPTADGTVTLSRRRIYILPTRHGLLFAVLLTVMLLGSANYSNSLGFVLTFLLSSFAVVSILHTYRNLSQLRLLPGKANPVFAGDLARFEVRLDNTGPVARFGVELGTRAGTGSRADVPAFAQSAATLSVLTERRGLHRLGRFCVSTRYPVGLFRAWSYLDLDLACLVYPQPVGVGAAPPRSAYRLDAQGDCGQGCDDFAGLRQYHPGDSLRRIHWKAAAHNDDLVTKQFGGDRAQQLWLDWEALGDPDPERRLGQLSRWVVDASRRQLTYGLRLPDQQITPARGHSHRHQCLAALAMFGQRP